MKYIKFFENFQNEEYPDVFNRKIQRGSKLNADEYIDDPSQRNVDIGISDNIDDYQFFMKNWKNLGIPDPTKSVHMYFRPKNNINKYGSTYDVFPLKGSKFGFTTNINGVGDFYFGDLENKMHNWKLNHIGYGEKVSKYQLDLIEKGIVGVLDYEDLVKMSEESGETLHIWTESKCLMKKFIHPSQIEKQKRISDRLENKSPIKDSFSIGPLKLGDFRERGLTDDNIRDFLRSHSRSVSNSSREESLNVLDNFKSSL